MTPEMQQRLRDRLQQRDESEKQSLRDILEEHERGSPGETALALACTVHELRDNFRRLQRAIDGALAGEGFITLQRWGPYHEAHVQRLTSIVE